MFAALWNLSAIWTRDKPQLVVISGSARFLLHRPHVIALRASEPVEVAVRIGRAQFRGLLAATSWALCSIPKGEGRTAILEHRELPQRTAAIDATAIREIP